jgi:hypothetical protein
MSGHVPYLCLYLLFDKKWWRAGGGHSVQCLIDFATRVYPGKRYRVQDYDSRAIVAES